MLLRAAGQRGCRPLLLHAWPLTEVDGYFGRSFRCPRCVQTCLSCTVFQLHFGREVNQGLLVLLFYAQNKNVLLCKYISSLFSVNSFFEVVLMELTSLELMFVIKEGKFSLSYV